MRLAEVAERALSRTSGGCGTSAYTVCVQPDHLHCCNWTSVNSQFRDESRTGTLYGPGPWLV